MTWPIYPIICLLMFFQQIYATDALPFCMYIYIQVLQFTNGTNVTYRVHMFYYVLLHKSSVCRNKENIKCKIYYSINEILDYGM
jgi:hypothetical protein